LEPLKCLVTIPGKFFQKKFKQNFSLPVYVYKKQQMKKIILYILPIISFSSCMLFQPSAKKLTNRALSANKQYDAVIVPGVPFLEPKWDRTMQMRVMWAIHLYKNGSTKKIIMSGGSVYSPYGRNPYLFRAFQCKSISTPPQGGWGNRVRVGNLLAACCWRFVCLCHKTSKKQKSKTSDH